MLAQETGINKTLALNSCHVEIILGNIETCLRFLSFLNASKTNVVEILPHG